jgi:protein O-GlcNAc transferase
MGACKFTTKSKVLAHEAFLKYCLQWSNLLLKIMPVTAPPITDPLTVDQALQQAIAHHQAGSLQEAERLYRAIINAVPNHPDANHNLGVLAVQVGQVEAGLPHLKAALEANPRQGQYWLSYIDALIQADQPDNAKQVLEQGRQFGVSGDAFDSLERNLKQPEPTPNYAEAQCNLGVALQGFGRLEEAKASYRRAIALKPDLAEAHNNLGNILNDLGRMEEAEASCRQAIALKPDLVEAHNNLGNILNGLGRLEEAEASCRQAIALKPDLAEAHNNLGNTLKKLGRPEEAEASYWQAIALKSGYADANSNLGNVLCDLGRHEEAEASFRRALEIKPDFAEAHSNLGNTLKDLGRLEEAETSYRKAIALKPSYADANSNLGNVLNDLGRQEEAEASFRRALEIKPDYAEAHNNLGMTLKGLGRLDEAEASFRCALEIKPDYAEAHNNLGMTLKGLGRLDEAEASYRRAIALKSDFVAAHSNLLFTLNYHPDKSAEQIFAAYREYNERHIDCHLVERPVYANDRNTDRRLRVGYVSPDFRKHSCAHTLEPLLTAHDRSAIELFAYAELEKQDAYTERFQSLVDYWIPTRGMSDTTLCERIRSDRIDILVDLAGHTAGNRLNVFALKPAPVQVSWLGYGYTTGLTAIDYYLTDDVCAPEGCEHLFSEIPWRLENPGAVYRPAEGMGEITSLPALERGYVTFGTLSRSVRINHRTVRVWSEILKQVPTARLVIDSANFRDESLCRTLREKFSAYGIDAGRLTMGFHSPPWDVLRGMDIGLDCFPHNSGLTLAESVYMGVPFVTLAGRPSVGRGGACVLTALGHPEWIAYSEEEYIEHAVALASDLTGLAEIRTKLRHEMEASPLMDEMGFVRKVEAAYRQMWEKWCEKS